MTSLHRMPLSFIPSPPVNGFHIGPLFVHFYGLMYVIGIALAVIITQRRVRSSGGDPSVVADVALWAVPAGIWRLRRHGVSFAPFADAVAPALLVAQAVGRIGNYFNQELYGKPTTLPWALVISHPHGYPRNTTFQPTFLYELIWDLALAALLVWIGHHTRIRPPGLFALYVTGYSAFRIYEETLRIDSSEHFLGLRLNLYVASALTLAGLAWFIISQRRAPAATAAPDGAANAAGAADGVTDDAEGADGLIGTDVDAGAADDGGGQKDVIPGRTSRRG